MAELPRSAPGLDGVPYAFWKVLPAEVAEYLDDAAHDMAQWVAPPRRLLESLTLFIPKGEYAGDADRVIRHVGELRPITLMQASAKVIASIANRELGEIAQKTVAREQRGVIEGRAIADNMIEMEGALLEYPQLPHSLPAMILLDFAMALPSLAHTWIWYIFRGIGINFSFLNLVQMLFDDLHTHNFHNGSKLRSFPFRAGMEQGCPMSGSIFAICADPLLRAHAARLVLYGGRSNLFAGDVAIVVRHIVVALAEIMRIFREWRRTSRLALKLPKCYEAFVIVVVQDMEMADNSVCLWVSVGPGAPERQWPVELSKLARRMLEMCAATSLMGRIVLCNTRLAPLYQYEARFTDPDAEAAKQYRHMQQRLQRAP